MRLTVLGINHRTAPVEIRGQVAFPPERLPGALGELIALEGVQEAAILSTCNRTELYCTEQGQKIETIADWLCRFHGLERNKLQPHFYRYEDAGAVRHILRVAAGLDSMILGEPQILGQMKASYQQATHAGTLDTLGNRLFQHTFSVAKQIRTDTAIGASPVSVAFAAVSLARQIFGNFEENTALLIGAGETIELATRHLHDHGIGKIIIANRTIERAHELADRFNGYGIALDQIPAHLVEADIVISSTGSPTYILDKVMVSKALRKRKHRPVFMVDIAVPGDIARDIAELDDVYFYTVDDLQEVIKENLKSRQDAAEQAEEIIDVQVEHFMSWVRSLDAVPAVRAYREHAEAVGTQELEKASRQLASGKDPQEVMESLTRNLINKLAHEPSVNLRQAIVDGQTGLLDAVRSLFRLKNS
ncbi:MAG: glutamyl-tRNA reductase [Halobacteria archaeon]|nr:glutamyl-tRNA reductase [Halobacteria archaeon]